MKFTSLLILSFILLFSTAVNAQKIVITDDFNNVPFDEFAKRVEEKTDYTFFYKSLWTDSLRVTYSARNEAIEPILKKVFEGTNLKFAVGPTNQVFITDNRDIMADLPPNYFTNNAATTTETTFDYSDYEKRDRQKKLLEEKLYNIGPKTTNLEGTATLIGTLRDQNNGEPIIGASIYIEKPQMSGTSTDQNGYFSLTIPKGRHEIKVKSIGMKGLRRQVMLYGNGRLDIEMEEDITPLKEVVIESERDARVSSVQMGMEKLDIRTMKQMPLALGETDIMKVVLALPGVQSVGEGTVGLNVRGGASNQNLILFNDAVVFNPSHLFGFFSTFNPDVLKNVELYKSGITADYGGRLSSVLDIHSREGNTKKLSGTGGISPITGRFTLEGPIYKDKTTFIIGGRSTYSNWILKQLDDEGLANSSASFYDINANITHKFNEANSIYASGYISSDKFKLNGDTTYKYSDRNLSLRWKHVISNKLYTVLSGAYSNYRYSISDDSNPMEAFTTDFDIKQVTGKADFHYFASAKHTLTGGIHVTRYGIMPGHTKPLGDQSIRLEEQVQNEQGLESAIYIGENFEVNNNLSIYGGIRYSVFNFLGEKDVLVYGTNGPRELVNVADTVHYDKGKNIATYSGIEPRVSIRYALSGDASIKASYNRMRQYIQMLSNTTAATPTDVWKLSDTYTKPQVGDQLSLGFYKNLKGGMYETSLEGYYKNISSTVDYKDGATLLESGSHIETEIIDARGKAYGVEMMVRKTAGKLNGWISYTYSRTFMKTTGTYSSEIVNKGVYYPSSFDKPHALNFIGNYKFTRRVNFSLNVIYNTGRPITLPVGKYTLEGSSRVIYSDRNSARIPDYFRMDISLNFEGNHKIKKLAHSSWTLAVYNLTGRANAYSVYFVTENDKIKGYKLSIFAQPIPTITYNFKF
jgi:hypothetical protein